MLETAASDRIRRNNLLFASAIVIVIFASALRLNWFEHVYQDQYNFSVSYSTGMKADLARPFRCPVWLLLLLSSLASLTIGLNAAGFTKVIRTIPVGVLALCGGFFLYGILGSSPSVHPQIGIWIALLNTFAALAIAFVPMPSPLPRARGKLSS